MAVALLAQHRGRHKVPVLEVESAETGWIPFKERPCMAIGKYLIRFCIRAPMHKHCDATIERTSPTTPVGNANRNPVSSQDKSRNSGLTLNHRYWGTVLISRSYRVITSSRRKKRYTRESFDETDISHCFVRSSRGDRSIV